MTYKIDATPMKVAFLTPFYKQNRGNSTTAKRIVNGLQEWNVKTEVFAYNEEKLTLHKKRRLESCDIIHILHFYRFASWADQNRFYLNKPFVITSGGTDINEDLFNKLHAEEMKEILENASMISVFTDDGKEKLKNVFPEIEQKVKIIPQSVWFEKKAPSKRYKLHEGEPKILLPSGLRVVKDIFFVMDEIIELRKDYPNLQFLIVGAVLDQSIYKHVQQLCTSYSWVHFVEDVPFDSMQQFYHWADYVLNTSISEGQSSAILEAMFCNSVVLARKNEGNVSIIQHHVNGFVFNNPTEFKDMFLMLQQNPKLSREITRNARTYVQSEHSLQGEIGSYIEVYQNILNEKTTD